MGQPRILGLAAVAVLALVVGLLVGQWDRKLPHPVPAGAAGEVRIASITPAGTDLVIGIGAADRLVGVSDFDEDRDGTTGKPRIGDYQSINWEKLAGLGANVLLLQYAQDRVPDYIQQKCADMGIKIVNLKLDTIDEIDQGMLTLGDAIGRPEQGRNAVAALRAKLDAVRARVAGRPRVRTLIVTDDLNFALAGPGEFLDEILQIAGGENAAKSLGKPYPQVDREMILSMAPDVVIRLVPDGDKKPQVVRQGDQIWNTLTDLPAVKNHRVYVLTEWYGELPSFRIGDLAGKFADILHPETVERPHQ
ncbi:MAG TPA: ABC transporter substrate-binding protein [Tepidisphaeraceae bacterium]|jgi:iron complex transport system substrate-binding protein|nr:ABC transporter substrate-binding protein [Tepidisphaeraceae bacterium]